jgi:uncharacterized protein
LASILFTLSMQIANKLKRILIWWGNLQFAPFVLVSLLISYLIFIFYIPVALFLPPRASSGEIQFFKIIESIIIAPVIETIIFQAGVIYLIDRFITKKITFQIAISSVFFGAFHNYNITYIFFGVFFGIVLSTAFILYERKNNWNDAYIAVVFIHALRNMIAIFFALIGNH